MTQIPDDAWMTEAKFFGDGYDKQLDLNRLTGNLRKVHAVMVAAMEVRAKVTLATISQQTGVPEASVSACLRTLRNQGGYVIEKERVTDVSGTWRYWIAGGGMGKHTRTPRKLKPIGDPVLFGEMMRTIYALAKCGAPSPEWCPNNEAKKALTAYNDWCADLVVKLRKGDES